MGMSFGDPDAHDPPYPDFMENALNIVKTALETTTSPSTPHGKTKR